MEARELAQCMLPHCMVVKILIRDLREVMTLRHCPGSRQPDLFILTCHDALCSSVPWLVARDSQAQLASLPPAIAPAIQPASLYRVQSMQRGSAPGKKHK